MRLRVLGGPVDGLRVEERADEFAGFDDRGVAGPPRPECWLYRQAVWAGKGEEPEIVWVYAGHTHRLCGVCGEVLPQSSHRCACVRSVV